MDSVSNGNDRVNCEYTPQELKSIRREIELGKAHPADFPSSREPDRDPLLDPKILCLILKERFLSQYDHKDYRLVSKLWNSVSTPHFRSKARVVLSSDAEVEEFCQDMKNTADFPYSNFHILPRNLTLESLQKFFTNFEPFVLTLSIDPDPNPKAWSKTDNSGRSDPMMLIKIIYMFREAWSLKSLTIGHIYREPDLLPYLEELTDVEQPFESLSNLHTLDLTISTGIPMGFYTNILVQAHKVQYMTVRRYPSDPLSVEDTVTLAESMPTQQIRKLKLSGVRYEFLENVNRFPLLNWFEIAHRQIRNQEEADILREFLTVHANQLSKLVLDEEVNLIQPKLIMNFPKFPNLKFFDSYEADLFSPVTPACAPKLRYTKLTVATLRDRFTGSHGNVRVVDLYGYPEDEEEYNLMNILPHLKLCFPNLIRFEFTLCQPSELIWIFQNLTQLEILELICDNIENYDLDAVLIGIEDETANWIFDDSLKKMEEAGESELEIKEFTKNFILTWGTGPSIRDMTRLTCIRINFDSTLSGRALSDKCIYLTFHQMPSPMKLLLLENLGISYKGYYLLQPYLNVFLRKYRDKKQLGIGISFD